MGVISTGYKVCWHCKDRHLLTEEFWYRIDTSKIECRIKIKARSKKYTEKHAESNRQRASTWYLANRQKVLDKQRIQREAKAKLRPKRIRKTEAEYSQVRLANRKKKLATDPGYRILYRLRKRLRKALAAQSTRKKNKFVEILGCTNEQLKQHLEAQFKPGMSWNNYGKSGWHVDHIIPLSKVDLTREEELKRVAHYSNLQPLWARDNISKGAKLEPTRRFYWE